VTVPVFVEADSRSDAVDKVLGPDPQSNPLLQDALQNAFIFDDSSVEPDTTLDDLLELSPPNGDGDRWSLIADLRGQPGFGSLNNNEIGDLLEAEGLLKADEADTESACFYAYFDSEARAKEFQAALREFIVERMHKHA